MMRSRDHFYRTCAISMRFLLRAEGVFVQIRHPLLNIRPEISFSKLFAFRKTRFSCSFFRSVWFPFPCPFRVRVRVRARVRVRNEYVLELVRVSIRIELELVLV